MILDASPYAFFRALHVAGVVLLLGNVTVSAVWKAFADRRGAPAVMAFGQRMITITEWFITLPGVVLVIVGGYGMLHATDGLVGQPRWLLLSQALFYGSGMIWLLRLIPLQMRLGRLARRLEADADAMPAFRRTSGVWLFWGLLATVPLVAAFWLMVAKPGL